MNAKWIVFFELQPAEKTKRWGVLPKGSCSQIGLVKWYGPWRKYCFFPDIGSLYEWDCLRDIAAFCEEQTKEHKQKKHEDRLKSI